MDWCNNGGGAAEASPLSTSSILRGDRSRARRRKHSELCPTHSWKSIYKISHMLNVAISVNLLRPWSNTGPNPKLYIIVNIAVYIPVSFSCSSYCPLQFLPSEQVGCSHQSALEPVHHSSAQSPGQVRAPSEAPQTRSWSHYRSQSLGGKLGGVKDIWHASIKVQFFKS